MPLQNFVDFLPPSVKAAWLNAVDVLKFTVFNDAATKAAARTALELNPQLVAEGTDSGAANAAVVTLVGPVTNYVRATGTKVSFLAAAVNTGAATLNVNGTGAAAILAKDGTACTGGELFLPVTVEWTGAAWRIVSGSIPNDYRRTAQETFTSTVPLNYSYLPEDVRRFNADPTGAVNAATAFNLATFGASSAWIPPLLASGRPPFVTDTGPGRYALSSTVYVRSGGAVRGQGMATLIDASGFGASANSVFRMGWGLIAGVPTLDSGGYPPEICNMFFNGGPSGGGACVYQSFPGGLIHDIWFAAAGLGVYLAGGYLYDCEFDLGLVGVLVGPSTNQTISNCRFFNPNFCINFDVSSTDIADMIISGCTFEYPQFAAITIGSGTGRVRDLKVTDCIFTNNADYATYQTLINISNSNCIVTFENCSFFNWKNYAVTLAATGAVVMFKDCLFDGLPTHSSFSASTTSKGFSFSLGTLIIKNCEARNLDGTFIDFSGASAANLIIEGLTYSAIGGATVVNITNSNTSSTFKASNVVGDGVTTFVNNQSTIPLRMSDMTDWFGAQATSGARDYVLVPYQQSCIYRVTLTANQNVGGSGAYRKSSTKFVQKDNDFTGTARSYINLTTAIEGAAHTNPVIDVTAEFGAVGGGVDIASSDSGNIAINWPTGYAFERLDIQLLNSG